MKQYLLAIIAVLAAIIFALFSFDTANNQYSTRSYKTYSYNSAPNAWSGTGNGTLSVFQEDNAGGAVAPLTEANPTAGNLSALPEAGSPLSAPPAMLATTSMMELTPVQLPPLDAGMVNVTGGFDGNGQTAGYRVNPRPGEFSIAVPYDPSLLPQGFSEDDIQTYVYDRQYHRWIAIQRDSVNEAELLVCSRFRPWEKGLPHTQNDLANPQDALAQVQDMMSFAPQGEGGGDSPLDFINAVLKTPEMPENSAYTPTSIKELKAADPLEGLTLMQPPTANNSGTANLSYPIEVPAGRQGMQPNLALTYSSGGGNGWLGVGWDISIPSITVETRWGVPRYDQNKESETYLLNGEQLATKDSEGNYEPLPHRAAWRQRYGDGKQFYPRVEGSFQQIIRHGFKPSNYWWEIRDKQGVTYYYGKKIDQDTIDLDAVLSDNKGNVAQWMLTEVRDLKGNYVRYEYQTIRQGNSSNSPRNIYPKEISYTLHDSLDATSAHYALSFVLKPNNESPTTSGRFGFLQTFDQLLEAIVVKLQWDEWMYQRIKAYTFCYETGMYGKKVLANIGQIAYDSTFKEGQTDGAFCSSPANLVTHTFEYYDETDIGEVFGDTITITTGNDQDAAKRIIPMKIAASSLGGVFSDGWNVGGALTVGFGENPAQKGLTVGGDYMHSRSESEGILALIDIDGDGLPDKVFRSRDNDCLYYRSQYVGQDGHPHFSGERTPIAGINGFMNERSRSNDWGLEAHLSFYGAGASAAYNNSTSRASGTSYFSDVDGDGLPDIVKGGQVYFNRYVPGNDSLRFTRITSETVMVGGSCDSSFIFQDEPVNENMFLPGDTVITIWYERKVAYDTLGYKEYVYYVEHCDTTITEAITEYTPDFDAVKMWEAPYNGVVRLESKARLTQNLQFARYASHVMDGVRISIQKNDGADLFIREPLSPDTLSQDGRICLDTTLVGIPVKKGDRFYFRVESLDKRLYDKVFWNPKFVYTEIDGVTPEDTDLVDADGRYIYKFSSAEDFLINPDRKYHIAMDSVSTITVESDFSILEKLSDDVILHFYHNGQDPITPVVFPKMQTVSHHTDSFSITVNEGDSIWFELECGTNVNWKAIDWRARYYYTQVSDTSIELWDSYTDTAQILPAIVYDNLVPHLTSYPHPVLPTFRIRTDRDLDISFAKIYLDGSNGIANATFSLKEENNGAVLTYPLSFDMDGIASLETDFIMTSGNVYYLDLYSNDYYELADVRRAYISLWDGRDLELGLHISQPDSMLVFGDMYQNWGQFSYRKGMPDERELDESRLVVSQKAQTPPDTTSTTLDTTDASAFHAGLSNAVFDPVEESFLMCEPDHDANRWLGYGNIVYFSPDTISNTYSSDPTEVDETEFPVPVTVDGSLAFAVFRNSITKTHTINVGVSVGIPVNGGNVSPSGGKSWHWGNTRTLSDFYDMNGDRYPDVISDMQVQYTKPQGGLSSLKLGHNILGSPLDTTTFNGESFSFGASFTLAKKVPSSKKSSRQHEIGGSAGLNGCSGENWDEDEHIWTDVNGDGLPDRVSKTGKVFYNLGYSFVDGGLFGSCGRAGSSKNIGGSTGGGFNYGLLDSLVVQGLKKDDNSEAKPTEVNLFETSISAGYGFTRNINNTDKMMVDVNGDGLQDCVRRGNGVLKVRYNKGGGFLPEETLLSGEENLYTTLSTCSNINGAISVGFSLGCFPIKFVVNPKGGYTRSMGKTEVQLMDINGDGLPDYVTSGDIGHLQVRFNQSGKANLLKSVTNLAGGGMTMDYKLSDYMGYDCPNRIQVLDSLFVYDGLEDDWNDTMRYSFEYDSAYYDRFERTSYGFGVVKTHSLNSNRTVYRTVTERYSNRFYKFRNLKTYELLTDGNERKYVEKFFSYVPKEIATGDVVNVETAFCFGKNYPALNKEEVLYYDDDENVRVITRKHYKHGPFGNLIKYTDAGQAGVTEDSIIVSMTYHLDSFNLNLTGMVNRVEARDGSGNLLRKKDCEVNHNTGQILSLRQYNDNDTAVTDFAYDTFGNMVQVTGPANNETQRVIYRYSYDSDLHTYPVSVKNVPFGYISTTAYDFRLGKPLSTTDINGNVMTYTYDRSGRLESILAPADTGYTLRFEYWITYGDTVHQGDNPWARTSHFDIQHPDNPLNTTVIADGLGRVVQTRKDAEVGGFETSLVSGVVVYDCFGRAVKQFYPFTDGVLTETYFQSDTSNGLASTTTYDILDRQILVTQPHGVRTAMAYGFGQKGGKWYFLSSATDAKQNMLTTLTDSRGLQVQQTAPGNAVTKFSYNPLGQLTSSTDPMNLTTTYTYDKFGQITERMHPDAGTDTYEYDAAGNMLSHTNGNNKTIQYRYDYNRLTDVEYPDYPANNVHYTYGDSTAGYNGKGRVVMQEDGSGWQTFKYGTLGEIIENVRTFTLPFEQRSYSFKTSFNYDSYNRIQNMTYPDGEVVSYEYNRGGMLNKVFGSVTRNLWEMIEPIQVQGGLTEPDGMMGGGIAVPIDPPVGPIEPQTITYRYPYIDSIIYNVFELKDSVVYGNGTRVSYEYDSLQRLSHLRSYIASGTKMQDITYSYDSASNITHISNSAGSVSGLGGRYEGHYTYDNLYRLVAANGYWKNSRDSLPFSESMNYTANGRILKKTVNARILNGNHSTTKSSDFRYSYAGYGNQVSSIVDRTQPTITQSFRWYGNGNVRDWTLLSGIGIQWIRTHTWTEDNRLQTVADNNWFSYYQYDAGGERTYKLTWAGSTSNRSGDRSIYYTPDEATLYASPYLVITPQGYTKHYYAESERITSQLGKGQFADVGTPVVSDSLVQVKLQSVTGNVEYPSTLTVPGSGVFAYLDTLTNQQNATSTLYFYHPDHLGSSSWITTTNGTVKQHLHYLPWGEDFVNQRSSHFDGVRYTFSAKEKDTETGYSYFGARYYSSDLSIWLSVDPMAAKYPSLSPYVYCADNPVNTIDPNGCDTIDVKFNTESNLWELGTHSIVKGNDVIRLTDGDGNVSSCEFSEGEYGKRICSFRIEDNGTQTFGVFLLSGKDEAGFFVEPTGTPSNSEKGVPVECGIFNIQECKGDRWNGWPEQYNDNVKYGRGVCIHYCWSKRREAMGNDNQSNLSAKDWTTKCMVVSSKYSMSGSVVKFDGHQSKSMAQKVAQYCGVSKFNVRSGNYDSCTWDVNNGCIRIVKSNY